MPKSSRDIAYHVLVEHRKTGVLVADLLESHGVSVTRDDVRLASEIVYTTIRRRETLDTVIAAHVKRPADQVERDLWTLLQLGACQILLLETPAHAAVHETVETARRCGNPRWTGFLNGSLRGIARTTEKEKPVANEPAADRVPLRDGTFRVLNKPIFPDPERDFAAYIQSAYSFPGWLVERWMQRGTKQDVIAWANWFNAPPQLTLRANTLVADREALLAAVMNHGIPGEAGQNSDAVVLSKRYAVPTLPGFEQGTFAVQDESAMAASCLLNPQPGERVLDLCAGSGSKSCHLAALMQNQGEVVAVDNHSDRLERLTQNTDRLGITNITPMHADGTDPETLGGDYDAVLVDVPCSNSGVLGKRPEVRWRLEPSEIPELVQLQMSLLTAATAAAKVGGRVVYSTCSCESEENELLVAAFLKANSNVTLEKQQSHVPGNPGDGAYQALLIKNA